MIRRLLRVLLAVVLVLALAFAGAWLYVRSSGRTQRTGELTLAGLQSPVTIYRDEDGVTHIVAATMHDAFMAQGYVHAQDRLFQMDFQRRVGAGRLSEVLGEATLKTDEFLRTLGTHRAAEQDLEVVNSDTLAALQAYADGVNAFIQTNHNKLPVEFRILGYKPEPWQPVDTLVWGKMMAWNLGGNWENELMNARLIAALGSDKAAELLTRYPADGPFIIPPEVKSYSGMNSVDMSAVWAIKNLLGAHDPGVGSNNWVVAGSRTTTGAPLLANDPHLGMQIPAVWYANSLHVGDWYVTGVTFPGTPGVVIGHNNRIAWGVTNVGPDVQDLFIEKLNPDNPNQYEFRGAWQDMQVIEEQIKVKGRAEPETLTVRVTRHGPLINDVTSSLGSDAPPMALQWTALQGLPLSQSILNIGQAQNWDEFRTALRDFAAPSQNFVYADVDGNIGYQMPGLVPIRAQGDGTMPAPGWTGEYEWTGYIPFDELPSVFNPSSGYIATANNQVVPDSYPYLISTDWSAPYRAERIVTLLTGKPQLSPDDFAAIQGDIHPVFVDHLMPLIAGLTLPTDASDGARAALSALQTWDRQMTTGAPEPLLFEQFQKELLQDALGDELTAAGGETLPQDFFADFRSITTQTLDHLAQTPASPWWDDINTPAAENEQDIAARAFIAAVDTLQAAHGDDWKRWQWGDVHRTNFDHLVFASVNPLDKLFNRTIAARGSSFTVNAAGVDYANFSMNSGASYRQIVDLGNLPASRFIFTTGQSGDVFSSQYDNLIKRWQAVEYIPMDRAPADLAKDAAQTLTLNPGTP